ncbi:MAG TPA: hypothetical protein PKV98_04350 [Burkholderiaceae bacterium]|nr:hypothetical protein [Burkholderiaceae bacterium]
MIDKDPPDNPSGQLLEEALEPDTTAELLAPADRQAFAYALVDGNVSLFVVIDGTAHANVMSAAQARSLGQQLIDSANTDDANW